MSENETIKKVSYWRIHSFYISQYIGPVININSSLRTANQFHSRLSGQAMSQTVITTAIGTAKFNIEPDGNWLTR
jgi:hypothetical protein